MIDRKAILKKVFQPNICVGQKFQLLEILAYSFGLKLTSALILSQNLDIAMASNCPSLGLNVGAASSGD